MSRNRESRMAEDRNPAAAEPSRTCRPALAEKVAFLRRPQSYAHAPRRVEAIETHMSWIFLTAELVHKLKKPVRYRFLDFRSLAARRRNCEAEVRLNRRLAPAVYLGAVPLVVDAEGGLRLDGEGEIIDWLVRMRRLPSERMLDRAIRDGTVRAVQLEAVARLLAEFFTAAIRVPIRPQTFRRRLAGGIAESAAELSDPAFDLSEERVARVRDRLGETLAGKAALFDRRVVAGHVVEGHGDLRPEHVCLGPDPAVIDCLEFRREFRLLDWADELSFLAMECERLGAPGPGAAILEACCRRLDDSPPPALIAFYKAQRALLRARLAILHLRDEEVRDAHVWRPRALEYLELAETYAAPPG
jgi:aminoglycoside phosphotransferase family enzyme